MGPSLPGEVGEPAGPRTRGQVARMSWSNIRDNGPDPESHKPACQPHGPSDPSVSRSGGVVDITSTRTLA